jgi:hypothetical protein
MAGDATSMIEILAARARQQHERDLQVTSRARTEDLMADESAEELGQSPVCHQINTFAWAHQIRVKTPSGLHPVRVVFPVSADLFLNSPFTANRPIVSDALQDMGRVKRFRVFKITQRDSHKSGLNFPTNDSGIVRVSACSPTAGMKRKFLMKAVKFRHSFPFYVTCHQSVVLNCARGREISARFACGHARTRARLESKHPPEANPPTLTRTIASP